MVDQDFGRKNDPMSRPTLDSTNIGTNATNRTTSPIDSIPVRTKMPDPTPLTLPTEFTEKMEKRTYQGKRIHTHHRQTHHLTNIIRQIIEIPVNQRKRNAIRRKIVVNTGKMTRQTHHLATILIRPTIVITDASDAR